MLPGCFYQPGSMPRIMRIIYVGEDRHVPEVGRDFKHNEAFEGDIRLTRKFPHLFVSEQKVKETLENELGEYECKNCGERFMKREEFKEHIKQYKKLADIIIPHHDRHDHLKNCLDELPNYLFNIIIVSGGSFAENCNKGARLAETDHLIFVNDDTIPTVSALKGLISNQYDIVGIGQTIPGEIEEYWGIGLENRKGRLDGFMCREIEDVVMPTGFLFGIKRKVWEELQGFDESFINGGEDSDLGLRALKLGFKIAIYKDLIVHKHSQSEGRLDYSSANKKLLFEKWPEKEMKKVAKKAEIIEKPLNILVATNHLIALGGSEIWTETMVSELRKRGNNVDLFTLREGLVSESLGGKTQKLRSEYDLIIINHNTCLQALKDVKGKKIFTSHGIYPEIEQAQPGADKYVGISEEVVEKMVADGFPASLIRNGIDCEKFSPENVINEKPKRVLCMCQGKEAQEKIEEACKKLDIEFDYLDRTERNVQDRIEKADIVFSLGRGVYEAMACGRAVIVYDSRGYTNHVADGIITKDNIDEIVKNNCSGRRFELEWGVSEIIVEIKKYDPWICEFNRNYALENFNIEKQVDKYLNL